MESSIGEKIRELRQKYKLSQQDLADSLGVSRQTVSNYELGTTVPDVKMLKQIAEALSVDAGSLLRKENEKSEEQSERPTVLCSLIVLISLWGLMLVLWVIVRLIRPLPIGVIIWNGVLFLPAMIISGVIVSILFRRMFARRHRLASRTFEWGLGCFTALTLFAFLLMIINALGGIGGGFTFGTGIGYECYKLSLKMAPLAFLSGCSLQTLLIQAKTVEKGKSFWQLLIVFMLIAMVLSVVVLMPKEKQYDKFEQTSIWEYSEGGMVYYLCSENEWLPRGETALGDKRIRCFVLDEKDNNDSIRDYMKAMAFLEQEEWMSEMNSLPESIRCAVEIIVETEKQNQEPGYVLKNVRIRYTEGKTTEGISEAEFRVYFLDAAHPLQMSRESLLSRNMEWKTPDSWSACYFDDDLFYAGIRISGELQTDDGKRIISINTEWNR